MQEVKEQSDPELVVLETDNVLFKDDGFRSGTPPPPPPHSLPSGHLATTT